MNDVQTSAALPGHGPDLDDPTVEICDLPAPSALAMHLARLEQEDARVKRHRRFEAGLSLSGTCAILLGLAVFVGPDKVESGLIDREATAMGGVPLKTSTVLPLTGLVKKQSTVSGQTTQVAQRALTGGSSAARRECMTQVESAVLFHRLAKDAASQGAYNVAVNREIKRLLERHPIGSGRTLDLIGMRSWEGRSQPAAPSTWWTTQYQRCELIRSQGERYVVHL
ncbi:MAG: hypothetical protein ABI859_17650 [Pseudomonadota bacterium]